MVCQTDSIVPFAAIHCSAWRLLGAALCLICLFPTSGYAEDPYGYKNRGDRSEGIRSQPVSGDRIALISVRAAPVGGPSGSAPEQMRLTFYLPEQGPVQVTVRELDNKTFYWMDKVRPAAPWRGGRVNSFHWPTRDVLQWLFTREDEKKRLRPDDLGAVVRLKDVDAPSARERVAPVVLSGDDRPVALQSYLFTFKSNLQARLTCSLYQGEGRDAVWTKTLKQVEAGRPFSCQVPVDVLKKGDYRLVVEGYATKDSTAISEQVRFFHSPRLK